MFRATFRWRIVLFACWMACLNAGSGFADDTPERTVGDHIPNIILIVCDDLGLGDVSPFGNTLIKTRALENMAAGGLKLTSFYAAGSVCTPSRAGLLTGRYAVRMGLGHETLGVNDARGLPENEWTLAEAFKDAGYATACIGKWHLGDRLQFHPLRHGFVEFFGLPYSNDMNPLPLLDGVATVEEPAQQDTLTQRYTQRATDFITDHRTQPFFLYLAHSMPHVPLHASEKFKGVSEAGAYGDVVEEIDWSVERIMERLTMLDLTDNTLVIFTSDNGPWFEGSSGGQRGRKGDPWGGGYRVPFIAQWSGHLPEGTISDVPVCAVDLLPTLLELAGIQIPKDVDLDGRSFAGLMKNPSERPNWMFERPLYFFDNNRLAAIRKGPWLFNVMTRYRNAVLNLDGSSYYSPGLLFDLSRDPAAEYSLTSRYPEQAREMSDLLQKGAVDFGVAEGSPTLYSTLKSKISVKKVTAAALLGIAVAFALGIWFGRRQARRLGPVV